MDSFNHNCRLCDKDASQVVEKIKHDLSEAKPQYNSLKTSFSQTCQRAEVIF